METFKKNLQEFAQKHRKDIRKDPTFRAHFQKMCANIGVDPLACIVNNIHKQCPPPLLL
jgi:ESCRT-II complex subunit VPS22